MKAARTIKTLLIVLALGVALGAGYFLGVGQTPAPAPGVSDGHNHTETAGKQQYTCGMHPFIIRDEPGLCPICGMQLTPLKTGTGGAKATAKPSGERKIKYWKAPMDPTYIRNAPGKSPMGMDLVPVYEDETATGQIAVDPVTIQSMGIRTAPVARRNLARTIRTVGLVTYEEPRQSSINSKIDGWIEHLNIDQTGQVVRKGQALMEIYSPELVAAQEEFLLALDSSRRLGQSPFPEIAAGSQRLLAASRNRLSYWDISAAQIDVLEKSREVRKTMTLYAPYGGVVTVKKAFKGMRVMAGEELLQLSDISKVWVNAEIYEYQLPWLKVGQKAQVEIPFAIGKTLEGTITYLYPYVENDTRTVKARIEFANPGMALKPDMYANVVIATEPVTGALAIPGDAVLNSGREKTVFVARGEGKFEPRVVKTGVSDDDGYVQITGGLLDGEQVVTSAQFMLDSESKLREAIQKMQEPKGETPAPAPAGKQDKLDDLFK